ncbi:MAG: hypothetical protein QNJ23_08290 [Woeseiaceae bacterium]|nr:hypothetical protein [Woeseiaceae bacterium]
MRFIRFPALALIASVGLIAGCASTATSDDSFSNVLVIGIAGDYNNRAHFERQIVSQIRQQGASASTWYSIVGGNNPVEREDVLAAVEQNGFDAVLAVRRLDGTVDMKVKKSRTEIDATPIGDRFLNLFRSNYTDYTKAESVSLSSSALLAVELYDTSTQEIVFSFDHETKSETNLGLLIDRTAETIVRRLNREGLLGS